MTPFDTYEVFKEKFAVKNYDDECLAVKLFLKENDVRINPKGSEIVNFFSGKNVLITGATGFLGKLAIEKLLRSCEDINRVYLLVRPKKGKEFYSRVDEIFKDPVFFPLQDIHPKYRQKVFGIKGDVSLIGLGLEKTDRQMIIDKIDVIFHIAATTKFDELIKIATAINVRGTAEMLSLAKQCKNLKAFVHVSTAYSNCARKDIDETLYDPPMPPETLIALTEKYSDSALETMLPKILGKFPNTYAFTKAVAEGLLKTNAEGIPCCLYRPSIVVATYQEPYRGWVDNLFGPTGIVTGTGCGLIRVCLADKEKTAELVPADFTTNAMIAAAYHTATQKSNEIKVYNYVSGPENRMTWGQFMDWNIKYGADIFPMRSIWYFSLILTRNPLIFQIYSFFLHFVPAFFVDIFLSLSGKKLRMTKIYKKIQKFMEVIAFFSLQNWEYSNKNVQSLWKSLNESDQRAFPFSIKLVNWKDHTITFVAGARTFLLKESWSNLAEARKRRQRFYILHTAVKILFAGLLLFLLNSILKLFL